MGIADELEGIMRQLPPAPARLPRVQPAAWVPRGVVYRMVVPSMESGGRPEPVVVINADDLDEFRADWARRVSVPALAESRVADLAIAGACEQWFAEQQAKDAAGGSALAKMINYKGN